MQNKPQHHHQLFKPITTTTKPPVRHPKPIKTLPPYKAKTTSYPTFPSSRDSPSLPDRELKPNPDEVVNVGGVPYTILIIVGVVILCINCVAMAAIYYQRDKLVRQARELKGGEESGASKESETDPFVPPAPEYNSESERRSRNRKKSDEKYDRRSNSESTSRVSSLSRESSRRRKSSHSHEQEASTDTVLNSKPNQPLAKVQGHKRSKSDHSIYFEIEKYKHIKTGKSDNQDAKAIKNQSVTFESKPGLAPKNMNRSNTSIASKSSVKSSSSRVSSKSASSKSGQKNIVAFKPLKKNASCQSLPTSDYGWNESKDTQNSAKSRSDKQDVLANMQRKNYPKVLPDAAEVKGSATLPRAKPPPPPRSTSLTARDIQELEKLHEVYRSTHPPRLISTESCDLSGSEPFYSMGGGEAPARAPGMMYGTSIPCTPGTLPRNPCKADSPTYDQYQKYHHCYQPQNHQTLEQPGIQLNRNLTSRENRPPRGPLASFGKPREQFISPVSFGVGHVMEEPPAIPPPIPAHQVPLTPSILKNINPLLVHQPQSPVQHKKLNIPQATTIMDQSENTGTIKRQKARPNVFGTEHTEKPLKSALKSVSAYDKPKVSNSLNIGLEQPNTRPDEPGSPQSTSSISSATPSIESSGLSSPSEIKGILVKRTPRGSDSTPKHSDSGVGSTK